MADIKPPLVGVGEHPRAAFSIRRWKSRATLAGFAVAAVAAWWNGVPLAPDALLRGLLGGVAGYLIGGFAAVTVWRSMLQAETRLAVQRAAELRRREIERLRGADG